MKCNNFFCWYSENNETGCRYPINVKNCKQRKAFNRFKQGDGLYFDLLTTDLNKIKKELAK